MKIKEDLFDLREKWDLPRLESYDVDTLRGLNWERKSDVPIFALDDVSTRVIFQERISEKENEVRDDVWYLNHLTGLQVDTSRKVKYQNNQVIQFIEKAVVPDVKEIIKSGESELVNRVWLERVEDEKNNLDGYYVHATGVLLHEGKMPATPLLIVGYIDKETGDVWNTDYSDKKRDNKGVYIKTKERVEQWLVDRLIESQELFGGSPEQPAEKFLKFGPDTAMHLFINGWTGNHLEFMNHMKAMYRGIGKYSKDNRWLDKVAKEISTIAIDRKVPEYEQFIEKIIETLKSNPGQRDPRNHIMVGFANQGGANTTPDEVHTVLCGDKSRGLNESVTVQDAIDQPAYALNEFVNQVVKLKANWSDIDREIVLRRLAHVWAHSMGGFVMLNQLMPNVKNRDGALMWNLLESAGNKHYRVHAMNPLAYGNRVFSDHIESERVKRLFHSVTLPMAAQFLDPDSFMGLLIGNGARILTPKLIRMLNSQFGVSKRLTQYLLGSMKDPIAYGVHAQVGSGHGAAQYELNTRLCNEMRFFIQGNDSMNNIHQKNMSIMSADGRIDIANGSKDRILTFVSILLLGNKLDIESFIETVDHEIDPDEFEFLAPIVFAFMRGEWGPSVHPRSMLSGMVDDALLKSITKDKMSSHRTSSVYDHTRPL